MGRAATGRLDGFGPFALPFAVEQATAEGELPPLSGNEPGSDEAVLVTVDGAGTVIDRAVVEPGTPFTRWPVPVALDTGVATLWESPDGLFWVRATRLGTPRSPKRGPRT